MYLLFLFLMSSLTAGICTLAITDFYFYSIYFAKLREYGINLQKKHQSGYLHNIGYGLGCRYCVSHWASMFPVLIIYISCFQEMYFTGALFIPLMILVSARTAGIMSDFVFPPMVNQNVSDEQNDG